jgi:isopentenyl phosphate kinase
VTGSHGVDVTGGMWAKVKAMLALAEQHPNIEIRVISALCAGLVERALVEEDFAEGTRIAR